MKLLQDTSRIQGKTVVIITHNAAFEEIGDRVIRINSGTVVDEHTNSNPASAEGLVW